MRIAAIDIGTSRIKAALFDEAGQMLRLLDRRLDRAGSPDIQDAEVWSDTAEALLRELAHDARIDAVSLTGNMHALLGVTSDGRPVAPARLWCDNAATAESNELNERYGETLCERFGNRSIPVFTLPKLLKMRRETPDLYNQSACFLQSKDFVGFRLTGELVSDPTDSSGTLAMDLGSCRWADDILRDLGLDCAKLPEIRPSSALRGKITPESARRTGLTAGTPVVNGCGDLSSAALGSGTDDRTLSLTLGTAGQLLATGRPGNGKTLWHKLFVFAHADPERELYLGSVPAGGFCFEWMARCHNISVDRFFELAASCPTDAKLPIFLPYLLGRGAPYMEYEPCGAWFGLSASHRQEHLFRAAILGALAALRQSADLLESLAGARERVVLQALASREIAVRQCAGELLSQTGLLPENTEASLLGAAAVALASLGVHDTVGNAARSIFHAQELAPQSSPDAKEWYERYQAHACQL